MEYAGPLIYFFFLTILGTADYFFYALYITK